MYPQPDFYYQNGDKVNKETKDQMMEVVDMVMKFAEEFDDKGSESLGSFYDKAVDQLFNNDSQKDEKSKMVAAIEDYMNRFSMVSSTYLWLGKYLFSL